MINLHTRQRNTAISVLTALEASYADANQETASVYQLMKEELKGKSTEESNVLKECWQQKVSALEEQIRNQQKVSVYIRIRSYIRMWLVTTVNL